MWSKLKDALATKTQDEGSNKRMEIIRERDERDAHRRGEIRERLAPSLYPQSQDAWREGDDVKRCIWPPIGTWED